MIVPTLARLLVREHLYNPIRGRILTLGRQTIGMTYEQVLQLFRQEGYTHPDLKQLFAEENLDSRTRYGKGTGFISDAVFFKLMGITDMVAMDVSDYEGAEIIHNLNLPIPESLHNQFDFIIDGGTFDHLFDLRRAFANVVKMLRPGGRIFQWNAASNFTGSAYLSFGPDFFYDYFTINHFVDFNVYVAEVDSIGQRESWEFYEYIGAGESHHFRSSKIQMTVVLAQKGPSTTWNEMPVQSHYRDESSAQSHRNTHVVEQGRKLNASRPYQRIESGFLPWIFSRLAHSTPKEMLTKLAKRLFPVLGKRKLKRYRYIGRI